MMIKNKPLRLTISILSIFFLYFILYLSYEFSSVYHILLIEVAAATPLIMLLTSPISFSLIYLVNYTLTKKTERPERKKVISFFKIILVIFLVTVLLIISILFSEPISFSH